MSKSSGRPLNSIYETLGFELCKSDRKYAAQCLLCNRRLCNTAASRLKQHRNSCKGNPKGLPNQKLELKSEINDNETADGNEDDFGFPYKIETYPDPLYCNDEKTNEEEHIEPIEETISEPSAKIAKIYKTEEEEVTVPTKSVKWLMSEMTKVKAQMSNYIREHESEDEMLMKVMLQKMNRLPLPTKIRMQEKFLQDINNELLRIENEKF